MTLHTLAGGDVRITQTLQRPVVYLDHWAVRLLSEDLPLQARFVEAIKSSGGTWLFSTANLFEFVAMTDLNQARLTEELLLRVLPSLYVADITLDKGFLLHDGAPPHPDAPPTGWLLDDLADRARITGGAWNTHGFVQDTINHRDELLPLFEDMKRSVAMTVMSLTKDAERTKIAGNFAPKIGMTLRDALSQELLREPHINAGYVFNENDAVDLIHAVPVAIVCDHILLDSRWSHRLQSAARRIKSAGIKGAIAQSYSKRSVAEFIAALESYVRT